MPSLSESDGWREPKAEPAVEVVAVFMPLTLTLMLVSYPENPSGVVRRESGRLVLCEE